MQSFHAKSLDERSGASPVCLPQIVIERHGQVPLFVEGGRGDLAQFTSAHIDSLGG